VLICDSGPILAALDARDRDHEACSELLRRFAGDLSVPAPVVTEIALFLIRSYGHERHLRFLDSVAAGELDVLDLEPADHRRVARLCATYRDIALDQVDASVIAIVEREGAHTVASLDRRHFTIVRLADGNALELLPAT